MTMGGFAGGILHINLTTGEIKKEALDHDLAFNFLGGLGACIKLAYDHILPLTHPLAPDNLIVLGAGPFVGTSVVPPTSHPQPKCLQEPDDCWEDGMRDRGPPYLSRCHTQAP